MHEFVQAASYSGGSVTHDDGLEDLVDDGGKDSLVVVDAEVGEDLRQTLG